MRIRGIRASEKRNLGLFRSVSSRSRISPMPNLIPQRDKWDGHPVELGEAWSLRKGEGLARYALSAIRSGGSCA